jgi:hypothetical protein
MNEQRTYFGKDDPPDDQVEPAVPRTALIVLVSLFIAIPLVTLVLLIALSGTGDRKPSDSKLPSPPQAEETVRE